MAGGPLPSGGGAAHAGRRGARRWTTRPGFVVAHGAREEPGTGEIGLLYVAPHAWRTGIGAALLAAAEEWLADTGHDAAMLWTLEANDRGRRFSERCG